MMLPTCEVSWCQGCPEHIIGIGKVVVGVCSLHRNEARKISRKYGIKLFEATADVHDEFVNEIFNIKEKL